MIEKWLLIKWRIPLFPLFNSKIFYEFTHISVEQLITFQYFSGMKLFDWNPDSPYFLGIVLMIFCLIISILDKRLNIKVDFDEGIGHSGHTG